MNNIKNILKLSQDGGVTIIPTNKSQKVIPIIEENIKNKFLAPNTNLDLCNKSSSFSLLGACLRFFLMGQKLILIFLEKIPINYLKYYQKKI